MWWCLSSIRRLNSLPATTSDVPMKLSRIDVYLGFFSLSVFEANRQRSVAKPSITAPARGDTWNRNTKQKPFAIVEWNEQTFVTLQLLYLQVSRTVLKCLALVCLSQFQPPEELNKSPHTTATHQLCPRFQCNVPRCCSTLNHVFHVCVGTSCWVSPHLWPPNRQQEQNDGISCHTEVISNWWTRQESQIYAVFSGRDLKLPMMSSKHVEQSSAAAIASKINSFTRPWIEENRSRTFLAVCASAQHNTINAELISKSVSSAISWRHSRNSFNCAKKQFSFLCCAKNNFSSLRT